MSNGGGWSLLFQGVSTLAVVTIAALAVHESRRFGRRGKIDQLGLPPAMHERRVKMLRPDASAARRAFEAAIRRGDCELALVSLSNAAATAGAIAAHRDLEPPAADGAMVRRYRARCG